MALLDYFGPTAENRKSVHSFCAAMHEWVLGNVTRAQVIAAFGLTAQDETQLDLIKAEYDSQPTDFSKAQYVINIQSSLILYEDGLVTEVQVKTFLGLA